MTQLTDNWQTEFAKRRLKYWVEPARPTLQELKYIKQILKSALAKSKNLQVLVLGLTSEYRDLLIDLKITPTIIDFNKEN